MRPIPTLFWHILGMFMVKKVKNCGISNEDTAVLHKDIEVFYTGLIFFNTNKRD